MSIERPWALWISGFLAAVCTVHAVPLIIRHDLVIAGIQLSTTAALATAIFTLIAGFGAFKFAGLQAKS
ncbi:MAG: hypothetical protein KC502_05355 [Myxococcales bacterium]|nr:hypothetical protein [Myxococcales bacterium]